MKHYPLMAGLPETKLAETKLEPNSKLERRIGLGLFFVCLLGILINLFD